MHRKEDHAEDMLGGEEPPGSIAYHGRKENASNVVRDGFKDKENKQPCDTSEVEDFRSGDG